MLEVRIVSEEPIFTMVNKIYPNAKLDSILTEEQKWADQANLERTKDKLIVYGIAVVYIGLMLFVGTKIIKYIKQYKNIECLKIVDNVGKYFRDIPAEKHSTPARAAYLYYSKKNNFNGIHLHYSKIFSATLLQLALKKFISFEKNEKDFTINLLKEKNDSGLEQSEKIIFDLLCNLGKNDKFVTMSQIKKYAQKEYDRFNTIISRVESEALSENVGAHNYNVANKSMSDKYKSKSAAYVTGIFFSICFGIGFLIIPVLIEMAICAIILRKTANKINVLTEEGEIERLEWKGLKNYMEDFSLLKEKDVPDLILWEKYLVYATVFGIADKVIKQLKVVYPEFNNLDNSQYTYMPYITDSSFEKGFMNELSSGIESAYNSYRSAYNIAHSSDSSGSGGGGGFSSGGGGRRRRRPEWAEDSKENFV